MKTFNQPIFVNSFYFSGGQTFKSFPKKIDIDFGQVTFVDGIQYLIKKCAHSIRLFDITDGQSTYRLKLEDNDWTLISQK